MGFSKNFCDFLEPYAAEDACRAASGMSFAILGKSLSNSCVVEQRLRPEAFGQAMTPLRELTRCPASQPLASRPSTGRKIKLEIEMVVRLP